MIFKKLFGGGPEDLEKKARARLDTGDVGGALLLFQRAAAKYGDERLKSDIHGCQDMLALRRLTEAKRLMEQGDDDLAAEELEGAMEVVAGDDARAKIQAYVDSLQHSEAAEAAALVEVSDEERWMLIRGNWTTAQQEELDGYGEVLKNAMLNVHAATELDDARATIEGLLEGALSNDDAPRYLWLEAARVRLAQDEKPKAKAALESYLKMTDAEDVDQAWLGAQIALAHLCDDSDDFDGAMAHFTLAIDAFEDDPRPFFELGTFLLEKDCAEQAVDVLETASEIGDAEQPDWRILQELGVAYAETEEHAKAIGALESVISFMVGRAHLDFPPRTATRLARLHEEHGKLERAADLWAALSRGSDRKNHEQYHQEAGRVLEKLGLSDEASRMKKRAAAIREAQNDQ